MKVILTFIITGVLVASSFGQTRSVLVGTNSAVVQPTNFWSADATNARSGLGLGSAATNPASVFQQSSGVLSNLSSSNGVNLTNLRATNIVGVIPATNLSLGSLTNIGGILSITQGGTGTTNAAMARTNLGLGSTNDVVFNSANIGNGPIINGSGIFYVTATNGGLNLEEGKIKDISDNIVFDWSDAIDLVIGRPVDFGTNVSATRTNLNLGWLALTNTNSSTSLLGYNLSNILVGPSSNLVVTNAIVISNILFTNSLFIKEFTYNDYLQIDKDEDNQFAISLKDSGGSEIFNVIVASNSIFNTPITIGSTIDFNNKAQARTNLGLGWSALTNSNAGVGLVSVNTNGDVISPTNFWQVAPITTTIASSTPIVNATNTATNSRNLILTSLGIAITGVTNTIQLPTNSATFNGDSAIVVHSGGTNSATVIRQAGSATNFIVITNFDHAIRFLYSGNAWDFYHNIAYVEPIYFSGTNTISNVSTSRTNLGIPLAALTNTNNVNFQAAVFATNTTPSNTLLNSVAHWMEITVKTNGTNATFRIPLFQ